VTGKGIAILASVMVGAAVLMHRAYENSKPKMSNAVPGTALSGAPPYRALMR
jgi:hypothetical protein